MPFILLFKSFFSRINSVNVRGHKKLALLTVVLLALVFFTADRLHASNGFNTGVNTGGAAGEAIFRGLVGQDDPWMTTTGGGMSAGAAASLRLLTTQLENAIRAAFAGNEADYQTWMKLLLENLNSTETQQYLNTDSKYANALLDLGLATKDGSGKVSPVTETSKNALENSLGGSAAAASNRINNVLNNAIQGGTTVQWQSNGKLSEDSYKYQYSDSASFEAFLQSQGYTLKNGQWNTPNGVVDTVATAYNTLLRNGGSGYSPFTDDPACAYLVDGKLSGVDWLDEEDSGSDSGSGSNTSGTGHTAGSIGEGPKGSGSGSGSGGSGSGSGGNSPVACTSYTYNAWGACSSGIQTRTLAYQYPSGCTDTSSAVLTQNCTDGSASSTVCSSYVYGTWSSCSGNSQSRTILTQSPLGCTNTSSAVLTQACAVKVPVITNTTNAAQTVNNPILSVSTDSAATCQYSASSTFSYGAGITFATTGNYNHNGNLSNLTSGQHIYYVICKDNFTGGISAAEKITFTINLSQDSNNAPVVVSSTPVTQYGASPVLSATTDRPASCQYKQGATFAYGSGTALTTSDNYSHSVSISSLSDGSYVFYVACKDNSTAAVSTAIAINAQLSRTATDNSPVITNTTDTYQNTNSPAISITTTRNATCQYKEGGNFTYGSGTQFGVDGETSHSAQLGNVSDGSHTFYAVCKDTASGTANSSGTQIIFTVATAVPIVSNTTPAVQTIASSTLSVTTNRPASCQYKQGATFAYGSGTALTTSDNYSHSVSISSLSDGSYVFYVACKDNSTAAVSTGKQINTQIARATVDTAAPVITNITYGYQTTNNPTLAVTTDKAATCQYNASSFSYGNGTQFANDNNTSHSVQLSNLANGQHGYYVVCKSASGGATSPQGYQIIFTVDATGNADVCAGLSSNDRLNDGNRSNSGNTDAESVYAWQSVETGTREKFSTVDWHAGYQFTPKKDGQVTQLCGYFESGHTNKIALYNGTYTELASVQLAGNDSWKCVNISPVNVGMDKRYYVITKIENGPIYFEYKSGMLPVDTGDVVIEAGVRQVVAEDDSADLYKYDYMIFGLVDIKINFSTTTASGPQVTSISPIGTVYNSSAIISVQTADNANCRFGREDVPYADMSYVLPKIASESYAQKICGLEDGDYTFYVRCKNDSADVNYKSTIMQFTVEQ